MTNFQPGDRVVVEGDTGVVERIEDKWTVWVRLPIPGHPGKTDVIDFDPLELERADTSD